MPDFNNKVIFAGAAVTVVCPQKPEDKEVDAQHGYIVSGTPFGSGRLWEVQFDNRSFKNRLFEGFELLVDEPKRKPWLDEAED